MAREGAGGHEGDPGEETRHARRVAGELAARARGVPPAQVPGRLCEVCPTLLPIDGASVSVLGDGSGVGATLCASDRTAARLAEIQYTLGEGPGVQAGAARAPVLASDLTDGPDARRWPLFAVQALAPGARAVCSIPLGGAVTSLGTLDLYRATAGALNGRQIRTALLVADAVTLAVTALHRESDQADGVLPWLEEAEADHEEVYQATGMIMMQLDVDAEEALARLRARAFALGRTATEVARQVVDRTIDFGCGD